MISVAKQIALRLPCQETCFRHRSSEQVTCFTAPWCGDRQTLGTTQEVPMQKRIAILTAAMVSMAAVTSVAAVSSGASPVSRAPGSMVAIPGGSFTMGSPDTEPLRRPVEGPQHHVTLAPFFMGAAPVTQAQWSAVVLAHPRAIGRDLQPSPAFFRGVDLPVETITWNQAEELCLRLTGISGRAYRLPTEAEWEPAICRSAYRDAIEPTVTGWQGRVSLRVVCTV
jgi:formylglycine-generating enzyme required for sulfatase activity